MVMEMVMAIWLRLDGYGHMDMVIVMVAIMVMIRAMVCDDYEGYAL